MMGVLCGLVALTLGSAPTTGAPLVFGNSSYPAAALPESIEALDLNGDGHQDLVVVTSDEIIIFHGDGAGGLTRVQSLQGGDAGLRLADVTGDGLPDLIVGSQSGASLSLFQGLKGGLFAPGEPIAVGSGPVSVAVADFNNDGLLDIATGNLIDQSISLLLSGGHGSFAPAASFQTLLNSEVNSIAACDIDNDGDTDLLSAGGDFVTIFLNDGAGAFAQSQSVAAGVAPRSVQVGDLKQNGRLDIVVANETTNRVSLIQQFAPGLFLPPQSIAVGSRPGRLRLTDLDGDGDLDFATAHAATLFDISNPNESANVGDVALRGGEVRVYQNNGNGMFTETDRMYAGAWPRALAAADFDEDGRVDLMIASRALASSASPFVAIGSGQEEQGRSPSPVGYVTLAAGRGDASFASADRVLSAGASRIKLVDVDNDGAPDLIEGRSFGLIVRRNMGDGSFDLFATGVNTTGLPDTEPSFDFARIDNNNRLDLVIASSEGVKVAIGNTNGLFLPFNIVQEGSFRSVTLADVDGDDNVDILAGEQRPNRSDRFVILKGNGFAGFNRVLEVDIPDEPFVITAADLNGDQNADVAIACRSGMQVVIEILNGDNGVLTSQNVPLPGLVTTVHASDLDRDGDMDLVAEVNGDVSGAAILLNNGAGEFTFSRLVGSFPIASDVAVQDFNLDGWPDLALTNNEQDRIELFINDHAGGFINVESIVTGDFPRSIAVADIDGDDRADFAVAGLPPASNDPVMTTFSSIMTHLNIAQGMAAIGDLTGEGVVGPADLALLLQMWGPCAKGEACLADFNNDGVVDGADLALLLINWR